MKRVTKNLICVFFDHTSDYDSAGCLGILSFMITVNCGLCQTDRINDADCSSSIVGYFFLSLSETLLFFFVEHATSEIYTQKNIDCHKNLQGPCARTFLKIFLKVAKISVRWFVSFVYCSLPKTLWDLWDRKIFFKSGQSVFASEKQTLSGKQGGQMLPEHK